jgi:hypothetical protein
LRLVRQDLEARQQLASARPEVFPGDTEFRLPDCGRFLDRFNEVPQPLNPTSGDVADLSKTGSQFEVSFWFALPTGADTSSHLPEQ